MAAHLQRALFGEGIFTTVAQAYSLLTVASNAAPLCGYDRSADGLLTLAR